MNPLGKHNREGSLETPRESLKNQDYFEFEEANQPVSELAGPKHK